MLKLVLLAATAALMNAQGNVAAKPAPEPTKQSTAPLERKFTADEVKSLELIAAQMEVIRARNKVEDLEKQYKAFQDQMAPVSAQQQSIIEAACLSVGVEKEKIQTGGCGVALGVDALGKVITGPDGKPVESKVWRIDQKQPTPLNPTGTK